MKRLWALESHNYSGAVNEKKQTIPYVQGSKPSFTDHVAPDTIVGEDDDMFDLGLSPRVRRYTELIVAKGTKRSDQSGWKVFILHCPGLIRKYQTEYAPFVMCLSNYKSASEHWHESIYFWRKTSCS